MKKTLKKIFIIKNMIKKYYLKTLEENEYIYYFINIKLGKDL
jgi:hypothetical protein